MKCFYYTFQCVNGLIESKELFSTKVVLIRKCANIWPRVHMTVGRTHSGTHTKSYEMLYHIMCNIHKHTKNTYTCPYTSIFINIYTTRVDKNHKLNKCTCVIHMRQNLRRAKEINRYCDFQLSVPPLFYWHTQHTHTHTKPIYVI